jgi:hypothetical protein
MKTRSLLVLLHLVPLTLTVPAEAQRPIVYPAKGQSAEQQKKDDCCNRIYEKGRRVDRTPGNELGFGWTIGLDQESGDITITLVNA